MAQDQPIADGRNNSAHFFICEKCKILLPTSKKCIQDLPTEVMEYIIYLVSPYRDLENCMLVCRDWEKIGCNVIRRKKTGFVKSLKERSLVWRKFESGSGPAISARYGHSACQVNDSMYVFGGCTATTTTFNDLWQFNLNSRQWHRLAAVGTYPPPKANATFVPYKDKLILFGGWTYTSILNPIHQTRRMFNQLHFYTPETKTWIEVIGSSRPPPMAGHSATIQGNMMVVFGGGHLNERLQNSSNEVWVLDLLTNTWFNPETTDPKPESRFGQSQIHLSDRHILVFGGCGGPNMVFSDTWLLTISQETNKPWIWKKILVRNGHFAATHTWYHPACKVDNKVVFFGKSTQTKPSPSFTMSHTLRHGNNGNQAHSQYNRSVVDIETCVNGKRGIFTRRADNLSKSVETSSNELRPDRICSRCGDSVSWDRLRGVSSSAEDGASASKKVCDRPSSGDQPPIDCLPTTSAAHSISQNGVCETTSSSSTNNCVPPTNSTVTVRNTPLPSVRPNSMKNRQRQLEGYLRMEERMRSMLRPHAASLATVATAGLGNGPYSRRPAAARACSVTPTVPRSMSIYVMEIGRAVTDHEVEWLPIQNTVECGGPEDTSFYSLVCGIGELVMFGGVQKDVGSHLLNNNQDREVQMSNDVHILSSKPYLL